MTNAAAKERSLLFLAAAFALCAAILAAPAAEATRTLPAIAEPVHAHQRATLDALEDATPDPHRNAEKRLRLFEDLSWPTHPLELVQISKTASGVFDLGLDCNILEKGGLSQECGSPSFQGLWHDPTTGLAYARNRWYDARTASWLSEDPLGPVDSPNLYAFVGWGPHMGTDPMGAQAAPALASPPPPVPKPVGPPAKILQFPKPKPPVGASGTSGALAFLTTTKVSAATGAGIIAVPAFVAGGGITYLKVEQIEVDADAYAAEQRASSREAVHLRKLERIAAEALLSAKALFPLGDSPFRAIRDSYPINSVAYRYFDQRHNMYVEDAESRAQTGVERDLEIQRRLSAITKETRDAFLEDDDLLARYLRDGEIDRILADPWTMVRFFGTAVERRVAEMAAVDDLLSELEHTVQNAPQDFISESGINYDLTGNSRTSIRTHFAREGVDVVVTYDSIPAGFGYEWAERYQDD